MISFAFHMKLQEQILEKKVWKWYWYYATRFSPVTFLL